MALLSVIVPCYNEEENVHYFYEELMKNQPFTEVISILKIQRTHSLSSIISQRALLLSMVLI